MLTLGALLLLTPSCSTTYQSYTLKGTHDKNTQNHVFSKDEPIKIALLSKKHLHPDSLNITLFGYNRFRDADDKEIINAGYLNTLYHRAEQINSSNLEFPNEYLLTLHPQDIGTNSFNEYGYVIKSFRKRDSFEREFFNFLGGLEYNIFPGTRKISIDYHKKTLSSGTFERK